MISSKNASLSLLVMFLVAVISYVLFELLQSDDREEQAHYDRSETELRVSNPSGALLTLFHAGKSLSDTSQVTSFDRQSIWLTAGNYFLQVQDASGFSYIPVSLVGYRSGPDEDGGFDVTIRPRPKEVPLRLSEKLPEFLYIPGGWSLIGDRLNPREPHYVWLTGFFIAPFEVTNGEFREFINDPDGYELNSNWTDEGERWREMNISHSSALLTSANPDYARFGRNDQPITWVSWYEANAFCKWLTRKVGERRWLYSLPNEAEWEKVARGPDGFDYSLSMTLSDHETPLYNWKKNPDATVTVERVTAMPMNYRPNRFGVFHMCGNVVEWTQSINRSYNREHPFVDDDRNADEASGLRVARGGSWYSASIAYLYIPYRDAFQPEHSSQDIGFRIIAKALP